MQTMTKTTTVEVPETPRSLVPQETWVAPEITPTLPAEVAIPRKPRTRKAKATATARVEEPPTWRHTLLLWALAVALMALSACGGDPVTPGDVPTFRVEVSGEHFVVQVSGADAVAGLDARLAAGTVGVINGRILAGDGGFNSPWSWHMDPATVEVVDFAIEVCDGRPSMVEADLDYWLNTLGQFCPWGATVVERVE